MIDLQKIIKTINTRNHNVVFENKNFVNVQKWLNDTYKSGILEYVDHGGCCLVLNSAIEKEYVIKIFEKNRHNRITEYDDLVKKSLYMQSIGVNVLEPSALLYEDDNVFCYQQRKCVLFDSKSINPYLVLHILHDFTQMNKHNYFLVDLRFNNYGIFNNSIRLFDFHDDSISFGDTKMDFSMLQSNLKYLLDQCMRNLIDNDRENLQSLNDYVDFMNVQNPDTKFTNSNAKRNFVDLIIHQFNSQCTSRKDLEKWTSKTQYFMFLLPHQRFKNYQIGDIDCCGVITLHSHTNAKFEILNHVCQKLISQFPNEKFRILDAGCSIGLVSIKFAQSNANFDVHLNNLTKSELDIARQTVQSLFLSNITFDAGPIQNLNFSKKFDITCYFAIFHHLLNIYSFDYIIDHIVKSQTSKMTIIEIPVLPDVLLRSILAKNTIADIQTSNYKSLISSQTLFNYLQEKIKIVQFGKLEYHDDKLHRYFCVGLV